MSSTAAAQAEEAAAHLPVDIDPSCYPGQPETAGAEEGGAAAASASATPAPPRGVPTVLSKLQKWGDYESFGAPVPPSRFIPMKTPLSADILAHWQLPEAPRHRLTVGSLLHAQAAAGRRVGLLLDLSNHDCLYLDDIPPATAYTHVQLVAKELPPLEFVRQVAAVACAFWAAHPDDYIAIHCAYGFNRTGFVVVSCLVELFGLSVDDALAAFAAARPPGVKHQRFRDELHARYDGCPPQQQQQQVPGLQPAGSDSSSATLLAAARAPAAAAAAAPVAAACCSCCGAELCSADVEEQQQLRAAGAVLSSSPAAAVQLEPGCAAQLPECSTSTCVTTTSSTSTSQSARPAARTNSSSGGGGGWGGGGTGSSGGGGVRVPGMPPLPPAMMSPGAQLPPAAGALGSSPPAGRTPARCWSSNSFGDNSSIGCSPDSSALDLVSLRVSSMHSTASGISGPAGAGGAGGAGGNSSSQRGGGSGSEAGVRPQGAPISAALLAAAAGGSGGGSGTGFDGGFSSRRQQQQQRVEFLLDRPGVGGGSGSIDDLVGPGGSGSFGGSGALYGSEAAAAPAGCDGDDADDAEDEEGCFQMDSEQATPTPPHLKQQQRQPGARPHACCEQAAPCCDGGLPLRELDSLLASVNIEQQQPQQPQQQLLCDCSCHLHGSSLPGSGPGGSAPATGASSARCRVCQQQQQRPEPGSLPRRLSDISDGGGPPADENALLVNESFGEATSSELLANIRALQQRHLRAASVGGEGVAAAAEDRATLQNVPQQ